MLSKGEIIRIITDYIEVQNGYLSDFSYRTLEEFYPVYCDLDINLSNYNGHTKRWLFQDVLERANAEEQAKILNGVFKKYPVEYFNINKRQLKQRIYDEFQDIIKRFEQTNPILTQQDIEAHFVQIREEII